MQRQLATPGQYEEFGREGVEGGYRAEWYPSESILFLEPKKFVIESRETQGAVGCPSPAAARGFVARGGRASG